MKLHRLLSDGNPWPDVSILRSTARSIGCEGKRVKDSAADYVRDIWNVCFLLEDDHGKKIYVYLSFFLSVNTNDLDEFLDDNF